MPDTKVYHTAVTHDARMRIILVFWSFRRGYEPRLDRGLLKKTKILKEEKEKLKSKKLKKLINN
jgi:hypothetical protein